MLDEVKIYNVPVENFKLLFPDTFDVIVEKFSEFIDDDMNQVFIEDYKDWRRNGFVEVVIDGQDVSYTPFWPKKEFPGNDLPWAYDNVDDLDVEVLEEIEKYFVE